MSIKIDKNNELQQLFKNPDGKIELSNLLNQLKQFAQPEQIKLTTVQANLLLKESQQLINESKVFKLFLKQQIKVLMQLFNQGGGHKIAKSSVTQRYFTYHQHCVQYQSYLLNILGQPIYTVLINARTGHTYLIDESQVDLSQILYVDLKSLASGNFSLKYNASKISQQLNGVIELILPNNNLYKQINSTEALGGRQFRYNNQMQAASMGYIIEALAAQDLLNHLFPKEYNDLQKIAAQVTNTSGTMIGDISLPIHFYRQKRASMIQLAIKGVSKITQGSPEISGDRDLLSIAQQIIYQAQPKKIRTYLQEMQKNQLMKNSQSQIKWLENELTIDTQNLFDNFKKL